jgi:hypothetical protein
MYLAVLNTTCCFFLVIQGITAMHSLLHSLNDSSAKVQKQGFSLLDHTPEAPSEREREKRNSFD